MSGSQKGKSIKAASVEKAVDPGERVHSARTTPEDKVVSAAPKGKVSDTFLTDTLFACTNHA